MAARRGGGPHAAEEAEEEGRWGGEGLWGERREEEVEAEAETEVEPEPERGQTISKRVNRGKRSTCAQPPEAEAGPSGAAAARSRSRSRVHPRVRLRLRPRRLSAARRLLKERMAWVRSPAPSTRRCRMMTNGTRVPSAAAPRSV